MIWGFISSTDVECCCLKDPEYQNDLVDSPEHVKCHQNMASKLGDAYMEQHCGVKFKGKVFGLHLKSKITRSYDYDVIPTSIRTGFATVSSNLLKLDEYDPKQSKLSFGDNKNRTLKPGTGHVEHVLDVPGEATCATINDPRQSQSQTSQSTHRDSDQQGQKDQATQETTDKPTG